MSKKSKDVSFSSEEVAAFNSYAAYRRALYFEKVHARDMNPRLSGTGEEVLSEISTVADVDLVPLTTRQNISRFVKQKSEIVGDGYDTDFETDDFDNIHDRDELMPSRHELRAQDLDKRLSERREKARKAADAKKVDGATPPTQTDKGPVKDAPAAKSDDDQPVS